MSKNLKCRAAGGPENCNDPNCPELRNRMNIEIPDSFQTLLASKPKLEIPTGWGNEKTELLKTVHGSRLYGLSHANSDEDWYVVTPTRYASRKFRKQTIQGDQDVTYMDFKSFQQLADKGVPQALETMFSKKAVSPYFQDYREGYNASGPEVIHTYMRTIKSFSLTEKDPFKRRRHALRLALNMEEILYTGRFDPTLKKHQVDQITRYAEKPTQAYLRELKSVSPIEVDWEIPD